MRRNTQIIYVVLTLYYINKESEQRHRDAFFLGDPEVRQKAVVV